ncbi:MurR/RpiR family transcriptional regulator [Neobacillus sp.]|uniref:MurR/RpiR family transcriptional regulator n=1 Tax=Neobacillus sp. TaxID=2675273 RepID=UPI0028981AB7|nr:MurR/RpiR family transcriptional regulator [Neobacillus sp.]
MKLEELVNKYYDHLNQNDFYILKYILNNQDTCYKLGINELAGRCNISRSSILRMTQKIGFSGYSEFKMFLKWQNEANKDDKQSEDFVNSLVTDVNETIKYIHAKDMTDICALIDKAERIFVYGTGTAQSHCAKELHRMFLSMYRYLQVITAQAEWAMISADINEKDLIIIYSLSGDTPMLFPTLKMFVAKGVSVISITNLKNNRLASMTPHNLYASSSQIHLSNSIIDNSFTPFFLISEALFRNYVNYKINQK